MIVYRHADPRFPFLWETADQPGGRWHGPRDGPVQYFAGTPDGAWAEFLRHEEITQEGELENVRRAIWAVEIPEDVHGLEPKLSPDVLTGGLESYAACQSEARRLRATGATALRAPSAALVSGGARGWRVEGRLVPAASRDGEVLVLFGLWPQLVGWAATIAGSPHPSVLTRVRHLRA